MSFWSKMMSAVSTGWQAGTNDWKNGPQPPEWQARQARYQERYLLSQGELFLQGWRANQYRDDPRVYRNISLLWDHVSRVDDFYETIVYQGELVARPNEGAIPIIPDPSLSKDQVRALMEVHRAIWLKWNWAEQKSDRVGLTTRVGDCLTELEDNLQKRFPQPKIIWPGYVKNIELDQPGNVEWYELEYRVEERDDKGAVKETYTYRKEVDNEAFRYFKDDKPFDYGDGSVVTNPYGFVPAIWDRFKRRPGVDQFGNSATDESRQALLNMNSLFSHSRDFQHKAFFAPIIVTGKITKSGQTQIDLSKPAMEPSAMAQALTFLESSEGVDVRQASFDIGQTLAELELMRDGILGKHPEATFFEKMADAANITGPGADRIILPVRGRIEKARTNFDSRLTHLQQMTVSMGAFRARRGDWGKNLDPLRKTFLAFDEGSYDRGDMEYRINSGREIVPPSAMERIEKAQGIESLRTLYGLRMAGVEEAEAKVLLNEMREREAGYLLEDLAPREDVEEEEAA